MPEVILKAENISKQYRLGIVGTGTLGDDLKRWWYKLRGKDDPFLKIGDVNDRSSKGESSYVWALKDISFDVEQGEVLGIIGKNGAGKSTLLKILSRVTSPSTGQIKTRGRIASLLEVGTGFHPELTGRENIYLNGAILGMTKAEIAEKEEEIIAFSGCERYVDTPVKRYSSGMRVRLAFAVAAFLEPDILVIDEVLAVGDAEFQKKAIGKMQDISKGEGRTVLFVSHNMAAVKSLCTRAVVLEHGKIIFEGSVDKAVNYYLMRSRNSGSKIDLSKRKDRIGNGKFSFTDVKLLNKDGDEIFECLSGDFIKMQIHYKSSQKFNPDKFIFGFSLYDINENLVTGLSSIETGLKLKEIKENGYITWEIPSLLLRGGNYFLRLFASYTTAEPHDFLDLIENAYELNVLQGDYWRNNVINRMGNDLILPSKIY